jgi:hypothetical protein
MPILIPAKKLEEIKKQGLLETLLNAVGTNTEEAKDFLKELDFALQAYPPSAELYAVPKTAPAVGMVLTPRTAEKFKNILLKTYDKLVSEGPEFTKRYPVVTGIARTTSQVPAEALSKRFLAALAYIKARHPRLTKNLNIDLIHDIDVTTGLPTGFTGLYAPELNSVMVSEAIAKGNAGYLTDDIIRILKHELSHTTDRKAIRSIIPKEAQRSSTSDLIKELVQVERGEPYFSKLTELRALKNELSEFPKTRLGLPNDSEQFLLTPVNPGQMEAIKNLRKLLEDVFIVKKNLKVLKAQRGSELGDLLQAAQRADTNLNDLAQILAAKASIFAGDNPGFGKIRIPRELLIPYRYSEKLKQIKPEVDSITRLKGALLEFLK